MRTKAETEIEMAASILDATAQDYAEIERWWPLSRRGSNAQSALDSLKGRVAAARLCVGDALKAIEQETSNG